MIGEVGVPVDKVYMSYNIDQSEVYEVIENSDLWGNSIPEPCFVVDEITINSDDVNIIGKKKNVIKFCCRGIDYLMFNAEANDISEFEKHQSLKVKALGRFNKNEFNGKISLQFIIDDYSVDIGSSFFF